MESEESQQCPFCGLSFIDFKFHIGVHNECKMLEEKEGYWLLGKKRQEVEGMEDALRLVDSHLQLDLGEEEDLDEQEEKQLSADVFLLLVGELASDDAYACKEHNIHIE